MSSTESLEQMKYDKTAWLSTISSVICGYFSYGFIRGWPNYWSNMQNHLNDCNEIGQNCTQEQFLHQDEDHIDWHKDVANDTLHPDWVTKDHISSTDRCQDVIVSFLFRNVIFFYLTDGFLHHHSCFSVFQLAQPYVELSYQK